MQLFQNNYSGDNSVVVPRHIPTKDLVILLLYCGGIWN